MKMVDLRGVLKRHPTLTYKRRNKSDISIIAIHHSLTKTGTPEAFARYHVETNGWPGIGYHYTIQQDGTIYICNDIETISYHVGNSNKASIGICLVGDFRTEKPTEAQYQACLELVRTLQQAYPKTQIKGHSELPGYASKQCPVINMDQFRKDVKGEPNMMKWEEITKEAIAWVQYEGISTGERPRDPVTREEMFVMLQRLYLKLKK